MADATERDTDKQPLPTDLGEAREKLFRGELGKGLPRIDPADFDQVFMLALELHGAHRARLFQVNFTEWRALIRMAALCAPVMTRALALVDATDSREGTDAERAAASRGALEELLVLARTARPLLNGGSYVR